MRFLILTEGARTEINIFQRVLERYGLRVIRISRIESFTEPESLQLLGTELECDRTSVLIAQAPRNRLKDLLSYYRRDNIDLNLVFGSRDKEIYTRHNDETDSGLLLISSPCIEILSEPGRTEELRVKHLKEYKRERNNFFSDVLRLGMNAEEYIAENFEKLAVSYLDRNFNDFRDANVMNHPESVIKKVNELNFRSEEEVIYRYFTTVVYVLIACIFGFSIKTDSYSSLREFLLSHV